MFSGDIVLEILNVGIFQKFKKDATGKIERTLIKLLKETDWADIIKPAITPAASIPPRLYGLPKIHKEGCPLYPIINMIGTSTYNMAKYIAGLLMPCTGKTQAYV